MDKNRCMRIAVIGAGISGLSAGQMLREAGIDSVFTAHHKLYLAGRFAEREHYNVDAAIGSVMNHFYLARL